MKKLDQSGFHAIWMLVVFVILIVISGGYFVYDRSANQSSNDNKSQVIDKDKEPIKTTENSDNTKAIRGIVAFGKQKPCFGDKKDPQNPFSRNEKEFIEFIKLNTKQTRAEINCGSGAIYIGKNLQNNWEELFGSSAGVPSIIVEECALDEIVDIKNPTIVDDNYWGGKGTEQYKNATADVVKLCRDFVAKNSL